MTLLNEEYLIKVKSPTVQAIISFWIMVLVCGYQLSILVIHLFHSPIVKYLSATIFYPRFIHPHGRTARVRNVEATAAQLVTVHSPAMAFSFTFYVRF